MMCPPGVLYIAVAPVVTSWAVAGQQVVFLYCMLQTRVTLKAFPIATPRGRSSKFPWKGTKVELTPLYRGRRYHKSPNDATLQLCIPKQKLEQFFHPPLLAASCFCFALWFCPLPTYPVVFLHPGLPDGRTCIVLQPWKRANELGQRSQIVPDIKISLSHFTSCQFWTVLS